MGASVCDSSCVRMIVSALIFFRCGVVASYYSVSSVYIH